MSFQLLGRAPAAEEGDAWTTHASGRMRFGPPDPEPKEPDLEEIRARCPDGPSDAAELYSRAWEAGLRLGPGFRWMEQVWRSDGEALCRMRPPRDAAEEAYPLFPGLIDACLQLGYQPKMMEHSAPRTPTPSRSP